MSTNPVALPRNCDITSFSSGFTSRCSSLRFNLMPSSDSVRANTGASSPTTCAYSL